MPRSDTVTPAWNAAALIEQPTPEQFAGLPRVDIGDIPYNHFREARWIPGYLSRSDMQALSNRERAWAGRPIVRVPHLSADTTVNSSSYKLRRQGQDITREEREICPNENRKVTSDLFTNTVRRSIEDLKSILSNVLVSRRYNSIDHITARERR
ncbi:hypothetical protein FQN54_008707 [Arachnomyces sp. PD_36]|nr:hypothetical protein FQN54_008707 [Arachnomyces sp. PD_36]